MRGEWGRWNGMIRVLMRDRADGGYGREGVRELGRERHGGIWGRELGRKREREPRSYNVQSPSGNMLRRNRRHIRETSESHAGLHQQDDNPVLNEPEQQMQTTVEPAQTTVEPVTPASQSQHSKKTVRFEDSAERTSSGRRVKPPWRLDL